jgi:hypothetical protein
MDGNKYIPIFKQNNLSRWFSIKCYVFFNLLEEPFPERYIEPVKKSNNHGNIILKLWEGICGENGMTEKIREDIKRIRW